MAIAEIIAEIDAEISRLQQARELLSTDGSDATPKAKRGRPKGSAKKATAAKVSPKATKRVLSPEGRKAIADAMKRRWAERKKQQAK